MNNKLSLALFMAVVACVQAFSSSFAGTSVGQSTSNGNSVSMEYIPSGVSKEQWKKMKEAEKNKNKGKNLGKVGITSFKSRTFADWQASGGKNLFPVDPRSVKNPKELPYMQRPGGTADDADLKKKNNFFGNLFGKKKAAEPEPGPEKKTNWWNLS